MASIALTSIGGIIYLAEGTVLMCAMFHWWQGERKLDVFFLPKKPKMFAGGRCIGCPHVCMAMGGPSLYWPILIFRPPFALSEMSNFDTFYLTNLPG
jgi:hypothetical protein